MSKKQSSEGHVVLISHQVEISIIHNPTKAKSVSVTPLSADDWEILVRERRIPETVINLTDTSVIAGATCLVPGGQTLESTACS